MTSSPYEPRLTRGALVMLRQYPQPPLAVRFQFNPEKVSRRLTSTVATSQTAAANGGTPPKPATATADAPEPGHGQVTTSQPETMSFEVRLDSVDAAGTAQPAARRFGVLPALSALELMALPRPPDVAQRLAIRVGLTAGRRFETPVLVFVWGRRFVPARLTQLEIEEVEYDPSLVPTRVIATVHLEVIRGADPYSVGVDVAREAMAAYALVTSAVDVVRGGGL